MNMKRSLLLSLFALAIVAMTFGQSMAAITVQLNLRYNDPADATEGGTWDLLAKTDSAFGIASIVAVVNNIDLAGITLNTGIGAIPLESKITGSTVEFVYGQDLNGTAGVGKILNVGRGAGTPGNVADDDLYPGASATYDHMAKIASGTFAGTRPSLDTTTLTGFAGNEWTNAGMTTVTAASPVFTFGGGDGVRGDSVAADGLQLGDANRSGSVTGDDLNAVLLGFNTAGQDTWDEGDFNDTGTSNGDDLNEVLLRFNQTNAAPPALAAVPEPSTVMLVVASALLVASRRRV